jgi:hypothetical protein
MPRASVSINPVRLYLQGGILEHLTAECPSAARALSSLQVKNRFIPDMQSASWPYLQRYSRRAAISPAAAITPAQLVSEI